MVEIAMDAADMTAGEAPYLLADILLYSLPTRPPECHRPAHAAPAAIM